MNKDVLDTLRDYKDKCEGLENINDKLSNALLSAENKINKYKEVIDKAIEELKKGLHELEIRRREEVYIEQYIEQSIDILKEVE